MEPHAYGRRKSLEDIRDTHFTIRSAIMQVAPPVPRLAPYRERSPLNQGPFPHCVGYAGRGFLNAAPMMSRIDLPPTGIDLYHAAQDNDEWEGRDYDGTSVRGLMRAMQKAGLISSYVWGQTIPELIAWTNGGYGTGILGTFWYPAMDDVDAAGFIQEPAATATPVDGHAYRVNWYHVPSDSFLIVNSWGFGWGKEKNGHLSGMAWMRRRLLERLLREEGELAAPTQHLISAVIP